MRFEGSLNVDLNEITTNLVPYPGLHFLHSSMAPMANPIDTRLRHCERVQPLRIENMFTSVFRPDFQLLRSDPVNDKYLSCALLLRGNVRVSEAQRNIERLKTEKGLQFIHWNSDGFKVGLCDVPPVGIDYSCLCLANNCCMRHTFSSMRDRFVKLYRVKAHVHHYTSEGLMEVQDVVDALESSENLIARYTDLSNAQPPKQRHKLVPLF